MNDAEALRVLLLQEENMPLKLLVVDHDADTLELVHDVFGSERVETHTATDGAQAVAPIMERKFDGFLLEMEMPNTDGCRLASWIRQSPRNSHAPIIHMSSRHDAETVKRAYDAGGTFFLVKPLDRVRLSKLLRSTGAIMLDERRRYWRIPTSIPLQCAVGSREIPGCTIRNLSVTGMLVRGDGSLLPQTPVYLAFSLSNRSVVSAWGKVVRVDEAGQAGVRFTRLSRMDYQQILERIALESDAA